ncbi:MAG: FG-GAP-like repeat-containing protein [Sandaracinaceae bacterium]
MQHRPTPIALASLVALAAIGCDLAETVRLDGGAASLDGSLDLGRFVPPDLGPPLDVGVDGGLQGPVCEGVPCTPGQRCEAGDMRPTCVDNTCEDLACSPTEACRPHPLGGATCVSIACVSDIECAPEEHCDGTICIDDVCAPGRSRCDGPGRVLRCEDNGSGEVPLATCGSPSPFDSVCEERSAGSAACSCEDDWDCPSFTTCEVDRCVGTGVAPSCTLPPVPFAEALPAVEFAWGGASRDDDDAFDGTGTGTLAPYPRFGHVLNTPVVANLDDDNGDGLIDELDFPEILFASHRGNNPWGNAVLRAVHGGGPRRGADYFARCGDQLWQEGDGPDDTCADDQPDADAGAPVAVADLDGDGVPEIVVPTESNRFRILDNRGEERLHLPAGLAWDGTIGEAPSVADLDHDGLAEIVVGRTVYVLAVEAGVFSVRQRFVGTRSDGRNDDTSQMTCAADVRDDLPGMELVAGASLYRLPSPLPACGSPPCADEILELVWHAPDLPGQGSRLTGDGFCAVADVWGADRDEPPGPTNPLDGVPEVILVDDGDLTVLDAATGAIIDDRDLGGGERGGAPNVDDFDGDGFPEVASALEDFYVVVDLQGSTGAGGACPTWPTVIARGTELDGSHNPNPPRDPGGACATDGDCADASVCSPSLARCVCLHNGWRRDSDDNSSRATSSSVFDFNGDGAAEVIYNDECDFRVYDGLDGEVLFSAMNRSRTGIENPVVADVDNDGNAEVVTGSNTAVGNRCDEDGANPRGPNGLRVWGDPEDSWVSARRIWNQQSYHVVNATEGARVPEEAPASWGDFNGRTYNTYRSQPRSFGVAPDLTVVAVGVSSPGAGCGVLSDTIDVAFEVRNDGDLRVGPGVRVTLVGVWSDGEEALADASGDPVETALEASLEPGRSVFLSLAYDRADGARGTLPERVRVVVDPTGEDAPFGAERECRETNNALEAAVDPGGLRPDLRVELGTATVSCGAAEATLPVTVINEGTDGAEDVRIRVFAGDPSLGGTPLHEEVLPAAVPPEGRVVRSVTVPDFPFDREIRLFVVVDPDRAIDECNEANNAAGAPNRLVCFSGPG